MEALNCQAAIPLEIRDRNINPLSEVAENINNEKIINENIDKLVD